MFSLSREILNSELLKQKCQRIDAGGFVSFEGWVRDLNEGKKVTSLAYECYDDLALKEGQNIIEEAKQKFPILEAHCVHRTGHLMLGESAVWVGVSSEHRGEAFAACQYIINQVKVRVPVWKEEFYADGSKSWVNCAQCGAHAAEAGVNTDLFFEPPATEHSHEHHHDHHHDHKH